MSTCCRRRSGHRVDRTQGEAARIGALEYGHAVFEPFRGPRSGNFATALVYEYRKVTPGKEAQVLARFDGGSPALLERRVGSGRVLLWASGLDRPSSDLPLKPVFPVFVQQSMRYLAAYTEPQPWLTVGQVLDPDVAAGQKAGQRRARRADAVQQPSAAAGRRADVLELTEQGFYEVRTAGGTATDVAVVASNVDPAEGDLTPMDPKDIALAAAGAAGCSQSARRRHAADTGSAGEQPAALVVSAVRRNARARCRHAAVEPDGKDLTAGTG